MGGRLPLEDHLVFRGEHPGPVRPELGESRRVVPALRPPRTVHRPPRRERVHPVLVAARARKRVALVAAAAHSLRLHTLAEELQPAQGLSDVGPRLVTRWHHRRRYLLLAHHRREVPLVRFRLVQRPLRWGA